MAANGRQSPQTLAITQQGLMNVIETITPELLVASVCGDWCLFVGMTKSEKQVFVDG
ncbi:MAG: hypothetical protein MI756_19505 [Chromatiales bacterium]|nr:hypothetical protein [Chromatiales bacterium]